MCIRRSPPVLAALLAMTLQVTPALASAGLPGRVEGGGRADAPFGGSPKLPDVDVSGKTRGTAPRFHSGIGCTTILVFDEPMRAPVVVTVDPEVCEWP